MIGAPYYKRGEAVQAVLVLHEGQQGNAEEFRAGCKERLATYKCPQAVTFTAARYMARTTTGKILHRVLRERAVVE